MKTATKPKAKPTKASKPAPEKVVPPKPLNGPADLKPPAKDYSRPIKTLAADPENPRTIAGDNLLGLAKSMHDFGDLSGIVFNRRTNELVCGHQRVAALEREGVTTWWDGPGGPCLRHPVTAEVFPIRVVDWPRGRQRIANLVANSPHIAGEFTEEALQQLRALDHDAHFEALRLAELETTLAAKFAGEEGAGRGEDGGEGADGGDGSGESPEPPTTPFTQTGDTWVMGEHRLRCGDSFTQADREALLEGDRTVDLVLMDPPFAIYGSSTGIGADIADDKMIRPFFEQLFTFVYGTIKEFGHVYVCCDWRSWASIWEGAKRGRLSPKNCLVWDKGGAGLGSNYANTYELIGFFSRLPPPMAMAGTGKAGQRTVFASNILRHNRPSGDERQHNAAKPVPMFEELIGNSTEVGEVVADWFGGSGTTLIAAEKTGRRARVMEMEPRWCDVIVARWETLTGRRALLRRGDEPEREAFPQDARARARAQEGGDE